MHNINADHSIGLPCGFLENGWEEDVICRKSGKPPQAIASNSKDLLPAISPGIVEGEDPPLGGYCTYPFVLHTLPDPGAGDLVVVLGPGGQRGTANKPEKEGPVVG